ncbi:contractile injection system tape measure protein [Parabacteroides pacaensis]|uniref:contractile injection system tape measure protein n=1 Tax=Parabacteroides pacaensis TaxID=2086575 RepID=UPI000D0F3659|nr:contractile injection system tape measure protein [Parabacteroides pacaensis]
MIRVGKTYFDFHMQDEDFVRRLYHAWDTFCRVSFEEVIDKVLSSFDRSEQVIVIDKLEIDLGTFREKEFYEMFPLRLAEKVKDTFLTYLQNKEKENVKLYSTHHYQLNALSYYLLKGYFRWDAPSGQQSFPQLMTEVLHTIPEELRVFLLREGNKETLRQRLIWQLDDVLLESLVNLTETNDPEFIVSYTRFLITSHPRLHRPHIIRKDYRDVIWSLVLTYLWCESKGYYSRKQLVSRTIGQLAAHYNLPIRELLRLLTTGVERLTEGRMVLHELVGILYELQNENEFPPVSFPSEPFHRKTCLLPESLRKKLYIFLSSISGSLLYDDIKNDPQLETDLPSDLKNQLSQPLSCRKILQQLNEKEIYALTKVVLPQDSSMVISYAQQLEAEKEKGMFEGQAGSDFRIVKWEFLFSVALNVPSGSLDKKYLVEKVLQKLAAHYGLEYFRLLAFFNKYKEELPLWLQTTLDELYLDKLEEQMPSLLKESDSFFLPVHSSESERLRFLLIHPVSCRRLLKQLQEKEIILMAKILFPATSYFIIEYAAALDKANERGMLEGKAGSEFELIKWEFVFLVSLNSSFNKRILVLSVLRQIAAHYGLNVTDLLQYFYSEQQTSAFLGLEVNRIITELWEESKNKRIQADNPAASLCKDLEKLAAFMLFLQTGYFPMEKGSVYEVFLYLKKHQPKLLYQHLKAFATVYSPTILITKKETARTYAALLHWVLTQDKTFITALPEVQTLLLKLASLLQQAGGEKTNLDPLWLRELLFLAVQRNRSAFDITLQKNRLSKDKWQEVDIPFLLQLLSYYRQDQVATFIKKNKEEIKKLLLSTPEALQKLQTRMQLTPGIIEFFKQLYLSDNSFMQVLATALSGTSVSSLLARIIKNKEVFIRYMQYTKDKKAGSDKLSFTDYILHQFRREETEEIIYYLLTKEINTLHFIWKNEKTDQKQVYEFLVHAIPRIQWLWINRLGTVALRKVADEILLLEKRLPFQLNRGFISAWLLRFTTKVYENFSCSELFLCFYKELFYSIDEARRVKLVETATNFPQLYPGFTTVIRKIKHTGLKSTDIAVYEKEDAIMQNEEIDKHIFIKNAGMILLSPWFPQLFKMLELTHKNNFTSEADQIRAIFLLQAIINPDCTTEYEEQELFLNKLLTGYPLELPLPRALEINKQEQEMVKSMVTFAMQGWRQMKSTSLEGFRNSFLLREGYIEEKPNSWNLSITPHAIDVLLDTIPWSYNLIKYSWMPKRISISWRNQQ